MGEFPFTHGQSPWNSALRVIRKAYRIAYQGSIGSDEKVTEELNVISVKKRYFRANGFEGALLLFVAAWVIHRIFYGDEVSDLRQILQCFAIVVAIGPVSILKNNKRASTARSMSEKYLKTTPGYCVAPHVKLKGGIIRMASAPSSLVSSSELDDRLC